MIELMSKVEEEGGMEAALEMGSEKVVGRAEWVWMERREGRAQSKTYDWKGK